MKQEAWPSKRLWQTLHRRQEACHDLLATCRMNLSLMSSPQQLHSVDTTFVVAGGGPALAAAAPAVSAGAPAVPVRLSCARN